MAITPGDSCGGLADGALVRRCGELAAGGVDWLLVREKHRPDGNLAALSRRIVAEVAGSRTRVLVASRAEIALTAGAAGVHVGSDWSAVGSPRRHFAGGCVSCSCHSVEEVVAARRAGVDLVLFAPVFGKTVDGIEAVPGTGIGALREACRAAGDRLPVFALGGVTEENAAACVEAGASGVAAIRMFFG